MVLKNNLFLQVSKLLNEKTPVKSSSIQTGNTLNSNPIVIDTNAQIDMSVLNVKFKTINNSITTLENFTKNLPNCVLYGLDVYAYGANVIAISIGSILYNGKILQYDANYSLLMINDKSINTTITMDTSKVGIKYIIGYNDGIGGSYIIKTSPDINDIIIAKIVINDIGGDIDDDANQDRTNNYIVSGKDLTMNTNFKIDDDTRYELQNVMTNILAENIIGTLRLNSDLSISNQDNSVVLDSNGLKIFDNDVKFSEFNRDGVYFYNESNQLLSQYTKDGAVIGNISITPTTLQSTNFQTGNKGFKIASDGNVEFNNITARGTIVARSGTIGKWVIATNRLTDVDDTTGLAPGVVAGDGERYPFYAGATFANRADAPFRVTASGALFATNATISGNITANIINANSGYIGGWVIQDGLLSGGVMQLFSSGVIHSTNFNVSNTGVISATSAILKSATVSGTVTAGAGRIGGWTIGATTLKSTGGTITLSAANNGTIKVGSGANYLIMVGGASPYIQSSNFDNSAATPKGFKLSADGTIEAVDGVFRGKLQSNVFVKNQVNVVGGDLILATSTKIVLSATSVVTTLTLDSGVFTVNDIIKASNSAEYMLVTLVSASTNRITVTRGFNSTTAKAYNNKTVIYKVGVKSTTNKGYIELLGTNNVINIHNVNASTTTLTDTKPVQLGLLTQGIHTGKYGLYASVAQISGNITASTLTTKSGTIGGWTIGPTSITGGTTILNNNGNIHTPNFNVSTTGVVSATSAVLKTATVSGAITCSTLTANVAGTIAGWTITAGKLANGNVGMQPATYPFYAGNATAASAPFRVDTSGNLTATTVALDGGLTVGSTGSISTIGKVSYTSSASGIWMGYDTSNYKVNIGNATNYIKWTGTELDIKGNVNADNIQENYYVVDHATYGSNLNAFFSATTIAYPAVIQFEVGTYTLTSNITISAVSEITLQGFKTSVISLGSNTIIINRFQNIFLDNLSFTATSGIMFDINSDGAGFDYHTDMYIENCNFTGGSTVLNFAADNLNIHKCSFDSIGNMIDRQISYTFIHIISIDNCFLHKCKNIVENITVMDEAAFAYIYINNCMMYNIDGYVLYDNATSVYTPEVNYVYINNNYLGFTNSTNSTGVLYSKGSTLTGNISNNNLIWVDTIFTGGYISCNLDNNKITYCKILCKGVSTCSFSNSMVSNNYITSLSNVNFKLLENVQLSDIIFNNNTNINAYNVPSTGVTSIGDSYFTNNIGFTLEGI